MSWPLSGPEYMVCKRTIRKKSERCRAEVFMFWRVRSTAGGRLHLSTALVAYLPVLGGNRRSVYDGTAVAVR